MTQRTRFAGALLVMTIITILASFFISYFLVGGQFFPQLAVVPTPTPIPSPSPTPSPTPTPTPSPTPTPFPTSIPATLPTPSPTPAPFISSSAAYLIDADTNRVLYDVNSLEQLPIASITKIMTAIVAIEKGNLEQGLTVQQSDLDQVPEGASSAGLVAKDYFRLRTLLYGLMLRSGTDAAIVIARVVSGSTENFVSMMNNKAQALGLTNTRFSTPHGFSSNNNYSCARDLVALANYTMRNPLFAQITSQTAYDVQPTLYTHAYHWENTNALLSSYEGADGVKTGWTEDAGVCLVFSARRNGQHLIGVVLHSSTYETVFEDGAKLLDLGFSKSE